GRDVTLEHDDRVSSRGAGYVDVRAVRTDRRARRIDETVDAGRAVFLSLDEGEEPRRGVATEHCHLVAHDVEALTVGAHRQALHGAEPLDAADALPQDLDHAQRPRRRIALKR